MKKQLTQVSVASAGKVSGVVHFLLSALVCLPAALLVYLMTHKMENLVIILVPFANWLVGYIIGIAVAACYNAAAKNFGGLEYYTQDAD